MGTLSVALMAMLIMAAPAATHLEMAYGGADVREQSLYAMYLPAFIISILLSALPDLRVFVASGLLPCVAVSATGATAAQLLSLALIMGSMPPADPEEADRQLLRQVALALDAEGVELQVNGYTRAVHGTLDTAEKIDVVLLDQTPVGRAALLVAHSPTRPIDAPARRLLASLASIALRY